MNLTGDSSFLVNSIYARRVRGFTLVEILVATALALIMMAAVVQVFGLVGRSVVDSRATLEMSDRLRTAASRLQSDLEGITVTMDPPRSPESHEGYFEYIEGRVGPVTAPADYATNTDIDASRPPAERRDTTVVDNDDILMFTTQSESLPFVGRYENAGGSIETIESNVAEVAWFVRGRTLYRRVLLVTPGTTINTAPAGFYQNNDISVHLDGSLVPNTLGDLTKRECRFAHGTSTSNLPFDTTNIWGDLRLPTLRECSHASWNACITEPTLSVLLLTSLATPYDAYDAWVNPLPWAELDQATGAHDDFLGPRIAEDVILTNVIGFDVKAWDPEAPVVQDASGTVALMPGDPGYNAALALVSSGAYVDLGYATALSPPSYFSAVPGLSDSAYVYDTWSTHYEYDSDGTDGFDNDDNGIVDDVGEKVTSAPYPYPLRGVQVKIRVFDPDSRKILQVTVKQDFRAE